MANKKGRKEPEDLIVEQIFDQLGITTPSYLDIGAGDPVSKNQTYRFYQKGSWGIIVEPNIDFFNQYKTSRPRDICLNIGVANESGIMFYYHIEGSNTLNTFSTKTLERYRTEGIIISGRIAVPVDTVENILISHWSGVCPDYLSIDTEGFDLRILESINFDLFRPKVICTETLTYSRKQGEKILDIPIFLQKMGYDLFKDTYVNSIFIDKAYA